MREKSFSVIVAPNLGGTPGRRHLAGILKFINEGHPWNVRIVGNRQDLVPLLQDPKSDADGYIGVATKDAERALAAQRMPLAILDFPTPLLYRRQHDIALITGDEEAIGARAAKYLLSLGRFASFGFVPSAERHPWSRLRERGFRAKLARHGVSANVYAPSKSTLGEWLLALRKPAAVLASFDFLAVDVLQACARNRIPVPNDVSVLGIDNDDILCEGSTPPLTSLAIDHERDAYCLARELDRMMSGNRRPGRIKLTGFVGNVVERESTANPKNAATAVSRALAFIREKAADGITPAQVVAHARVSRSLLYAAFAQATGTTVRKAIEDARLKIVLRNLSRKDLSIERISRLAGYQNAQRLKYVFKARFGCSMSDYRHIPAAPATPPRGR